MEDVENEASSDWFAALIPQDAGESEEITVETLTVLNVLNAFES